MEELIEALRNHRIGFIRLNFRNKSGNELSKRVISLGFKYENLKAKDLETLNNGIPFIPSPKGLYNEEHWQEAIQKIKKTFTNPSEARSEGQIDAYMTLLRDDGTESCIKYNYETKSLYIRGLTVHKEIIEEGVYPIVNSKAVTIARKKIEKDCLKVGKWFQGDVSGLSGRCKINHVEYETGQPGLELELLD